LNFISEMIDCDAIVTHKAPNFICLSFIFLESLVLCLNSSFSDFNAKVLVNLSFFEDFQNLNSKLLYCKNPIDKMES